MHIKVDTGACIGNGMCAALAPEHFEVSNDGDLTVLQDEVSQASLPTVQSAVLSCPAGAIKVAN